MKSARSVPIRLLLLLYILISGSYQVVGAFSIVVGFFDFRHQVHQPFEVGYNPPTVTSVEEGAHKAGLRVDDTIESLNGEPYWGKALLQKVRWYARVGDTMRLGVRHADGGRAVVLLPLTGFSFRPTVYDSILILLVHVIVPLLCLALGYWVVIARLLDLNAWLILILLSFPGSFIAVSTENCWPGVWLALRLAWHILLVILAPAALLWFGLLFPERSRIDVRWPWLKWLALAILSCGVVVALTIEYGQWYDLSLISNVEAWNKIDNIRPRHQLDDLLLYHPLLGRDLC